MSPQTHSIREMLDEASVRLSELPEIDARREAELLLIEAAGLSRTTLIAWPDRQLTLGQIQTFLALVERRRRGEPIAYIRGRQAFWDLDLQVTPSTLIPRPETELLVELVLEWLPADRPLLIADLGTGTGAIAAALARERENWTLLAVERSTAAIAIAAGNLRRLALTNVHALQSDWLNAVATKSLDAVVSNPPYVRDDDPHLDQGDLRFEPKRALTAGPDGLDAIRRIAGDAGRCLRQPGLLAIEHGYDQGDNVGKILATAGYRHIGTHRDLAGQDRITVGVTEALLDQRNHNLPLYLKRNRAQYIA